MEYPHQNRQQQVGQIYHGYDLDSRMSNANSSQPSPAAFPTDVDMDFYGVPNSFQNDTMNSGIDSTLFLNQSTTTNPMKPLSYDNGQQHVSPASMWLGNSNAPSYSGGNMFAGSYNPGSLVKHESESMRAKFGQPTPPEEDRLVGDPSSHRKHSQAKKNQSENRRESESMGSAPKGARTVSNSPSIDDEEAGLADSAEGPGKREKYREKNRVAAAKCRAKKKENVDVLEDNHRTQSVLNSALKQSEQSLRDELSYWRTQALQHTFCNCHPIQEYNMCKARNLAAGNSSSGFRDDPHRRGSVMHRSPDAMSPVSAASSADKHLSAASPVVDSSPVSKGSSFDSHSKQRGSGMQESSGVKNRTGGAGHDRKKRSSLRLSFSTVPPQ